MNSTDLPVTEWWDPEWDVYDVPISPFTGGPGGEMEVPYGVWWAAYEHLWMLDWITTGTAWHAPWPWQHQLEPPRRPPSWYPGQPEPPRPRPVKPCRCFYGLTRVPDAPGPHVPVTRPGIRRTEWLTRCFVLLFDCPHHGDDALDPEDWVAVVCHAEGQEWPWERILDPDERSDQ